MVNDVMAATQAIASGNAQVTVDLSAALQVIATGVIAIVGWIIKKGAERFEMAVDGFAKKLEQICKDHEQLKCQFNKLLGEHEARHGADAPNHGHRLHDTDGPVPAE